MNRGQLRLLAPLLIVVSGAAAADTTLLFEQVSGSGQVQQQPPMLIADGMIRFNPEGAEQNQYMLFDSSTSTFTVVDEKEGTYMPMTTGSFNQLSAMQQQMMEAMQEQLAQLPEERRAEVARMMEGMGSMPGMESQAKIRTERTSRTMQVDGHSCTVLEVYRGEKKISETCVTSRKNLSIPADDYQTLMSMQEFFMNASSQFFEMDESAYFYGDISRQEMPVRIVDFRDGGQQITRFRAASFDSIDPALFRIDPSFEKRDLMSGMSR